MKLDNRQRLSTSFIRERLSARLKVAMNVAKKRREFQLKIL